VCASIHCLAPQVLVLSLITAGLCALEQYIGPNALALPTSLFSLSAPSLGLLLVFRTNASYGQARPSADIVSAYMSTHRVRFGAYVV